MRSFASDNNSGCILVMEALSRANRDHAVGYGDDVWTEELSAKSGALLRIANRCLYSMEPAAMLLPYSYARVLIIR